MKKVRHDSKMMSSNVLVCPIKTQKPKEIRVFYGYDIRSWTLRNCFEPI